MGGAGDGADVAVRTHQHEFAGLQSKLADGQVIAEIDLPKTAQAKTLLRLRVPGNDRITSATANEKAINVDSETIDLTGLTGHVRVVARTR